MGTECSRKALPIQRVEGRELRVAFDGEHISSDGGVLLLRAAEERTGILAQFAECFDDHRDPDRVEHSVHDMLAQRVFGLALGYEDLNDHDELRRDPLLATAIGKRDPTGTKRARKRDAGASLAGSSTLNRVELSNPKTAARHRYKRVVMREEFVDQVFLDVFLQAHEKAPEEIVLDFDATDDPLYGQQEGRFFHGYYKCYCYLPLYVFCGEHLLVARLRKADQDGAAGTVDELDRLVPRIREQWPGVRIVVRGDSGFCRESIMKWCEDHDVHYVLGLARNPRLSKRIRSQMAEAKRAFKETSKAARAFAELQYRTRKTWSRRRRVIGKAEYLPKGENPRFVVTSFDKHEIGARHLYEKIYCARGEMENRIKEQQLYLFADRTSTHAMRSNQVRLYFSAIAYTLLEAIRRIGLRDTRLSRAQCCTIRNKLLKIGAVVRVTVRRVWITMARSCPYADLFAHVLCNLRAPPHCSA